MTEIGYKDLDKYLKDLKVKEKSGGFAPVYLIYGEEFLYKSALEALLNAMVPDAQRSLNYDPVDGLNDNIHDAIMRVNTYSLLSGTKVVALCDSKVFYSKQNDGQLFAKAKEAYDENDLTNAAKHLLNLLGILNLSYTDLGREDRNKVLKFDADSFDDDQWLDEIITYCRKAGLSIPAGGDSAEILQKAIEKGFPRGNHLIITTDLVDKRRILYKTIKQNGVIVDCSVPKGDRRADKMAQEAALNEKKGEILDRYKKTIDQDAYLAMYEMTGFDLRTCTQNLEKLISYVGDRKEITLDDVEAVIERTKKDPIYELTNAVAERSIERTLFFISSLLSADLHPLQILAAIINQVRKLMLVKGFVESAHGGNWHGGMDYGRFKNTIMPAIQNYDQALLDQMETWENMLADGSDADPAGSDKKNARKKIRAGTDLLVAKTPQNPYPVFLLLQNSAKYTMQELMAAMECLKQADLRLKSTRQRPKLILEEAIMKICSGPRRS